MNEKTVEQIKEAKALIEQGWCQRSYAFNKHDYPVIYNSPDAQRWCSTGALLRITMHNGLMCNLTQFFRSNLVRWNDSYQRTKEEVLKEFDSAITAAENNKPRQYPSDWRGEDT